MWPGPCYCADDQLQNRSIEIMLVAGTASCQAVNMSTYLVLTSVGLSFAYSQPCSYLTVKSGCVPDCAKYLQTVSGDNDSNMCCLHRTGAHRMGGQ